MASADEDTDEIYLDESDNESETDLSEIDWSWEDLENDIDDSLDEPEDSAYADQ